MVPGGVVLAGFAAFAPDASPHQAVIVATAAQAVGGVIGSIARDFEHSNGVSMSFWQKVIVMFFSRLFP